mmetsp:Transcript_30616/g.79932  ORF Transcript_30616/g.79932 Transcript_30616/m.79932 type:complete len:114 (-) Transcript_30616:2456-2797(-)
MYAWSVEAEKRVGRGRDRDRSEVKVYFVIMLVSLCFLLSHFFLPPFYHPQKQKDASGGASTSFASEEEGWDCMHQSVAELEKQIAYFQTQVIPQLDKMEGDYDKMLNSIPASS